MSEFVKAVVRGAHQVHHVVDPDEGEIVNTAADGVIKIHKDKFEELEKLGAVRKPTPKDKDPEVAVGGEAPAEKSVEVVASEKAAQVADAQAGEADNTKSQGRRGL